MNIKVLNLGFTVFCLATALMMPSQVWAEKKVKEPTSPSVTPPTERVLEFQVSSIEGVTHWTPKKVSVKPGEKLKIVLKHEIEGGYDFHGFKVDLLGIEKQVNRKKTLEIFATIPADAKKGEYPVRCHFHPKHVSATLVVE